MYPKSDILLLVDDFEYFREKYLKISHINSLKFLLLLMVEKGIRGGVCHAIYQYAKGNNK